MPVVFKVFVFLLLKMGIKTVIAPDNGIRSAAEIVVVDTTRINQSMVLEIESETLLVDQLVGICILQDFHCQVTRETLEEQPEQKSKATVLFPFMNEKQRGELMQRTQAIVASGKVHLYWQ